jgi:hypothetical protein
MTTPTSLYTSIDTPTVLNISILDSSGNQIMNDSSTTFKLQMTEENDNGSVTVSSSFSGTYNKSEEETFIVTDGSITLYIKDAQPEVVTITPTNITPEMTATSGTITFGSQRGSTILPEKWRDKGETARGR